MSLLLSTSLNHTASVFRMATSRIIQDRSVCKKFCTFLSTRLLYKVKSYNLLKPQNYCTRSVDVNTNIAKDVILYKYENPKYYRTLNIFGICQFIFWNYLSHFAFTTLKDAPVEKNASGELAWYQRFNLGENKYRNSITIFCFIIGYGILAAAWLFTLRSVRFLILRKGGNEVSFVTYTPFGKNRILTVPLKHVSAQESRDVARTQLPIKIKNQKLYYVLDMRGEFRNAKLYDHTAGMRRRNVE